MRPLRLVAFAVLALAELEGYLFGQSPYDAALLQGVQPFQSYDGGNLDSINLGTGTLSLHIPVVSFPQRGKLHLNYGLNYLNPSATEINGALGHDSYKVNASGIVFSNDAFPLALYAVETLPCTACATYSLALFEGNGTSHPLEFISAGTQARTVDGTGFLVKSPLASTCTITDSSGVTTAWGGNVVTATDPNGNQMTATVASKTGCYSSFDGPSSYISAWAITDSMGRQIPTVPGFFSGQWAVPGPNGGTATYQLTASGSQESLVLPDLTAYTFNFTTIPLPLVHDQTTAQTLDVLQSITLPSGGTITYGYTPETVLGTPSGVYYPAIRSRTVNANDGTGPHTWTYSYAYSYNSSTNMTTLITTVTDPLSNVSTHTFSPYGPYETQVLDKDSAG
jgi:hypothetical protein